MPSHAEFSLTTVFSVEDLVLSSHKHGRSSWQTIPSYASTCENRLETGYKEKTCIVTPGQGTAAKLWESTLVLTLHRSFSRSSVPPKSYFWRPCATRSTRDCWARGWMMAGPLWALSLQWGAGHQGQCHIRGPLFLTYLMGCFNQILRIFVKWIWGT